MFSQKMVRIRLRFGSARANFPWKYRFFEYICSVTALSYHNQDSYQLIGAFSKYKTVGFLVLASNETFLKHLKNGIEFFIFKCLNFQRKLYNVHWREKPLTNFWRNFLNHSINEAIWMHFRRKQSWLKVKLKNCIYC